MDPLDLEPRSARVSYLVGPLGPRTLDLLFYLVGPLGPRIVVTSVTKHPDKRKTLFIGPLQAIGKTVSALPRLRRPRAITAQSRTNIFHDKFLHVGMGVHVGVRLLYVSSYVCVLAAPVIRRSLVYLIRRICNATPLHRLPTGAFTGTPTSRSSF